MLRIGEFVELSSISINMLRHYDRIGLLVPSYIDEASGYRYYDKEQLIQANQIIALKEMGFGLEDIRKIMSQSQADINSFLQEKLHSKYEELEKTKRQIEHIKSVMNLENAEEYALNIVRKRMHAMWVASLCGEISTYPDEGIMWNRLGAACQKNHIMVEPLAPAIAIYKGVEEQSGKMQLEVQFPIDKCYTVENPLQVFKVEEQEVASMVFMGTYKKIYEINRMVAKWLEANKLEINGRVFTIYHKSPGNCTDENEFVTELCFPVKEKSIIYS